MTRSVVRLPTDSELQKIEKSCVAELSKLSIEGVDKQFCSRVCVMCDRFLAGSDVGHIIENRQLKKVCKRLKLSKSNFAALYCKGVLSCYGIADDLRSWKSKMLLSPRSLSSGEADGCLSCQECFECINKPTPTMPPFGIAKGFIIGHAPKVLKDLTVTELAIVSRTRSVAHVFSYFGGQHKSIRGWHTFYEAELPHTMNVLKKMDEFDLPKKMFAVLTGPFTTPQKARVMESLEINRDRIELAYNWLRENNCRYEHLPAIDINNLPEMQIVDDAT